jgi:hypothetical protein
VVTPFVALTWLLAVKLFRRTHSFAELKQKDRKLETDMVLHVLFKHCHLVAAVIMHACQHFSTWFNDEVNN